MMFLNRALDINFIFEYFYVAMNNYSLSPCNRNQNDD